jgi:hypothetical protein
MASCRGVAADMDDERFGTMLICGPFSEAGVEGPDGTSGIAGCIGSNAGMRKRFSGGLPPPPLSEVLRLMRRMRSDGPNWDMAGGGTGTSGPRVLLRGKKPGPPGAALDCMSLFGASKPSC